MPKTEHISGQEFLEKNLKDNKNLAKCFSIFAWRDTIKNKHQSEVLTLVGETEQFAQFFLYGRGGRGVALRKQACVLVFSLSREQLVAVRPTRVEPVGSIPQSK